MAFERGSIKNLIFSLVLGGSTVITPEVAYWSTVQQARAIKEGRFSSRELLELLIERESRINENLNAIVTLDLDRARLAADAAD